MESGAKGCEVIVSGKLRAARAKAMKFKDGYMVSSGEPTRTYIDNATRHVLLRQGVLGIKVGSEHDTASCLQFIFKPSIFLTWIHLPGMWSYPPRA
jgi:ribosomal protein S3